MSLPLHLLIHLVGTLSFGFWLAFKYKNSRLLFISLLTGIWIDLDHFFDYFIWAGFNFNLGHFFSPGDYVSGNQKVYVLLHGWEFVLVLYLLGKKFERKNPGITLALILPYLFHLLFDQFTSAASPLAYFFIYRFLCGFSLSCYQGFGIN